MLDGRNSSVIPVGSQIVRGCDESDPRDIIIQMRANAGTILLWAVKMGVRQARSCQVLAMRPPVRTVRKVFFFFPAYGKSGLTRRLVCMLPIWAVCTISRLGVDAIGTMQRKLEQAHQGRWQSGLAPKMARCPVKEWSSEVLGRCGSRWPQAV
jgi:hypothetical protein